MSGYPGYILQCHGIVVADPVPGVSAETPLKYWLIDLMSDWCIDWLPDASTSLTHWLIYSLTDWQTDMLDKIQIQHQKFLL